jgi:hypothetical protein
MDGFCYYITLRYVVSLSSRTNVENDWQTCVLLVIFWTNQPSVFPTRVALANIFRFAMIVLVHDSTTANTEVTNNCTCFQITSLYRKTVLENEKVHEISLSIDQFWISFPVEDGPIIDLYNYWYHTGPYFLLSLASRPLFQ